MCIYTDVYKNNAVLVYFLVAGQWNILAAKKERK
jgi:hypothetical protein